MEYRSLARGVPESHPLDALYGSLALDRPVDDLLEEMRGPSPGQR